MTRHSIYEQVSVRTEDGETLWTHTPIADLPVISAYGGPMTSTGRQILMVKILFPDTNLTVLREAALVGDRTPNALNLALRLNPVFAVRYEQAFKRVTTQKEFSEQDENIVKAAHNHRSVIAAALHDLNKPLPSTLHTITTPKELDEYLQDHQAVTIRPNHLEHEVEIGAIGEKTLLHAATGQGKSWAALWVAVKLAETKQRTAFLLSEGGKYAGGRIRTTWRKLELPDSLFPVLFVPFSQTNLDPEYINRIRKVLEAYKVRNIMLDVVSPLLTDENSAGEYNTIRKLLSPLTENRFYLEVHHHNKSGQPRGTGRIVDDAAYDFTIKQINRKPIMSPGTKSRGGTLTDWSVALDISGGYPKEQSPDPGTDIDEADIDNILLAATITSLYHTQNMPLLQSEILKAYNHGEQKMSRKKLASKLQTLVRLEIITRHPSARTLRGRKFDGYTIP